MTGKWSKVQEQGYEAWTGSSDRLSITVIPALGGKAVSLRNLATNREWLWTSGKPLGNNGFGSPFGEGDESGWDEMFPGINACTYAEEPWQGRSVPDHGEVWSLPWHAEESEGSLHCQVEGRNFPYTLEKTYTFSGPDTLRIDYVVTNRGEASLPFLWAAHPLFQAPEGLQIRVPEGMNAIEVSYSADERLGVFGDRRSWPIAGNGIDLSVVEPASSRSAEKYYFEGKAPEGWAELHDPGTGEAVRFRFPPDKVPYLAVWANSGGYGGHHHVALEPATGRMDDLAVAMERGEVAAVEPGGRYEWYLELQVK
ncbi:aldose epimerase family protein [Paenibacillus radicis (ex Gao et al. 2016)]|uniref:Aldose 1-epimerase n=1 Tax=Paenibacillus radicis (ex Gao et al. 2016) TaxID=1737354 RepID=A0A917GZI7_9BACL|nr:hypothetical protein [Paenibacillus radicis (ex Gao et al. 2016)]GGG62600.1 hypothetical protein GCM10010918_15450 [Paenibacillus radicis (ex Gao et al. 2016)]